ncbi:thiamine diphosphokinase [Fodinibius halophilus]|uniref:Thiamine diphosphokinase n=1 Tax=Fodinibius halophilus TaxID=1736908 RepID=A0A6M1T3G5_9BACT|nr:thiamine diphosphokinase [Fodinibius halophilus]NGP88627.1 thiamine diphosphokinase [Fodinibius halophilus]
MKKVLILCNGCPPSRALFHDNFAQADSFIAADGGANIAQNFNTLPDVVIGDLDSYEPLANEPYEVISRPDQEHNDLEKALTYARKKGGTHIHILGATGHRLDQTLKNLSVLKQFNSSFQSLVMKDNFGETQLIAPSYKTELPIGTTISLFPLSGSVTNVTTKGLKYPLTNESLTNGVRDGSSNEVVEQTVHITYKKGDLLLFVRR